MKDNSLPLHLKYRPETFDEFIGGGKELAGLKSILAREEGRPHTFLFSGPSGCGKTTLARIVKTELKCSDRDFKELNMSNTRGIATIREMVINCQYAPVDGPNKIYLLDECHKLTGDAQNAILKILEDTPKHVYFVLCTTEPNKLLKTIITRCTKFKVFSQRKNDIRKLIESVLEQEEVTDFPEDAIKEIASVAEGCPREALVILDSVIDIEDQEELSESIINYSVRQAAVLDLCRDLLANKSWKVIGGVLRNIDDEPEKVRYAVLGYMNSVLMKKENPQAAKIILNFMDSFMYSGKAGLTYACYMSNN
jgi:DNA polymerase III gamma/tau subunit